MPPSLTTDAPLQPLYSRQPRTKKGLVSDAAANYIITKVTKLADEHIKS